MVTASNFEQLRPLNFGIRALCEPLNADLIVREINRYNAEDAARVAQIVRKTAGPELVVATLVGLYEAVIDENRQSGGCKAADEGRAAAEYLRQLKIDMASHGAASLRLRARLERVPWLGKLGLKLVRRITGLPEP